MTQSLSRCPAPRIRNAPRFAAATMRPLLLVAVCALWPLLGSCADPSVRGGNVHLDEGRPEEAAAQFREAIARNPDNPEAHFLLAHVLAEEGEAAEAMIHYERAAELDRAYGPRGEEDRGRIVRRLVQESRQLLMEDRLSDAEIALDRATTLVPATAEIRFLQGQLRERREDLSGATEAYRAALALDPGLGEAKTALAGTVAHWARVRYDQGRFRDAEDLAAEAVSLDPQPDHFYLQGTIAYAQAQQTDGDTRLDHLNRAAVAFRRVLREDSGDDDARFNLGAVLLASEQFEEAAEVYLDLIARHPRQGDLYMALARAHSLVGELALTATEEAIGRALRVGEPVDDPSRWARRSAERFPHTELAATYFDLMVPDAIHTYTIPGGGLVEVWFYWSDAVVEVFREGGRVGPAFHLPRP